jgi:hypothetical protein
MADLNVPGDGSSVATDHAVTVEVAVTTDDGDMFTGAAHVSVIERDGEMVLVVLDDARLVNVENLGEEDGDE